MLIKKKEKSTYNRQSFERVERAQKEEVCTFSDTNITTTVTSHIEMTIHNQTETLSKAPIIKERISLIETT